MSVWLHYWHERAIRAEQNATTLAAALQRCVKDEPRRYAADVKKMVKRWALCPPRESAPTGPIADWSERAGIAEGDSDNLAALLKVSTVRHDPDSVAALQKYEINKDRRYGALPAGPTLQGNLAAGGITEF